MGAEKLTTHAVILAGGRGTRFWPRSRTRTPKQLLNIVGEHTMLQQTVARLRPLIPPERIWTVTNREQAAGVGKQVPPLARQRVLTEPIGRNTAAAIALAAIHVRHAARGDALMAVLPADPYIANPERYRVIVKAALEMASDPKKMVVLGIPPTRPETGFGYIERTGNALDAKGFPVYAVRRFTEKPALALAKESQSLFRTSMDNAGDMAVGFSASSASIFPQIRYAGRLASDPLNNLAISSTLRRRKWPNTRRCAKNISNERLNERASILG